MNKFYRRIKKIFGWIFRKLYRVRVINPENEVLDKPYVVCCNHTALMDVTIISANMKTQVHYMAKKEVFKVPILKSFAKAMGAFPVDRKRGDVGAVKKTIEILKSGECVGVFPQGTRHPYVHPRDTEIKNGIGMFADRAGVGILPVCIRTRKHKLKLFRKTEFIIGEYIPPEEIAFPELSGKEKYQKIAEYAFSRLVDLYDNTPPYVKKKKEKKSKKKNEAVAKEK
ncbi:MAG: 1-acyl-sn-glycerol-3-phosphate acyltransferase [Clostridia bacterium]|nr:1-acyl-sn-glycerol-3-phosphate acyltransferase [Clostridia bacterium]